MDNEMCKEDREGVDNKPGFVYSCSYCHREIHPSYRLFSNSKVINHDGEMFCNDRCANSFNPKKIFGGSRARKTERNEHT